ncbi:MAG: DUF3313 family protein [Candidatus Omnitrophica bacterium]|nr:DUF3313 family protein [Candidatus Omnitrophota bacterium]
MIRQKSGLFSVSILLSFIIISACASAFKSSGFLARSAELKKGSYFRQEWVSKDARFSKYTKVKVNEVNLSYFDNSVSRHSPEEIERLAGSFKENFASELGKNFQVLGAAEKPDAATFVVSPALLYVAAPERAINAATAWFFNFSISKGFAACEIKLTDGASGKLLAEFAEKRSGGGGVKDVKSLAIGNYTKFTHAQGAFKDWAESLLKFVLNSASFGG